MLARPGRDKHSQLVIEKLFNRTMRGPMDIYTRLDPTSVQQAVEKYGEQLMAAARGGEAEVVPISAVTTTGDEHVSRRWRLHAWISRSRFETACFLKHTIDRERWPRRPSGRRLQDEGDVRHIFGALVPGQEEDVPEGVPRHLY